MKKLIGAFTAIVTPFNSNGNIDIESLNRLVDFQVKNNISGIVPCGSTGEAATLTNKEYHLVIQTVVKRVKGRVPVIAGAGSNNTQKAVEFSLIAKKAGADALLHVTPYYNKPTPKGLYLHFKTIADNVDLPIVLYNVPGRTGSNVSAGVALEIAKKVDQVVAVKEASGDLSQMMSIIQKCSTNFSVLSGDDAMTLPLLSIGGNGCISVVSNQIPDQFTRLIEFGLDGDFENSKKLHYRYLNLMNNNFIETNPIPVKTALYMMGYVQEKFRLPLCPMQKDTKEVLRKTLKEVDLL